MSARSTALLLGLLLSALSLGCQNRSPGDEPLDLVPKAVPAEEPEPPPILQLEAELRPSGEGPASMRVPLPESDAGQEIASLLWQVAEGDFELEEREGQRWLKARTERLWLRVRFQRLEGSTTLAPETQSALAKLREARGEAWLEGARVAGLEVCMAHGFRWGEGEPELTSWPELQLPGGAWAPLDTSQGALLDVALLRLGAAAPEARRKAGSAPLLVKATIQEGAQDAPSGPQDSPPDEQHAESGE